TIRGRTSCRWKTASAAPYKREGELTYGRNARRQLESSRRRLHADVLAAEHYAILDGRGDPAVGGQDVVADAEPGGAGRLQEGARRADAARYGAGRSRHAEDSRSCRRPAAEGRARLHGHDGADSREVVQQHLHDAGDDGGDRRDLPLG